MDEITSLMWQQIKEIEARDESQILAELAGETINEYVYEVKQWDSRNKKELRKIKLSWAGVKEVARLRGNIVLSEPMITDTDDALRIVIKATDLTRNFTVFGGCHQPKKMKVNDYDKDSGEITGSHLEDDPFYFTKGLSKCQRNALNLCIPGDFAAKCIDRWLHSSGKPALQPSERKRITEKAPSRPTPKAPEEWDNVKKEDVKDFLALEKLIWDLAKIQPTDIYKELGFARKTDVNIPAWDCFTKLKEKYAPANQ